MLNFFNRIFPTQTRKKIFEQLTEIGATHQDYVWMMASDMSSMYRDFNIVIKAPIEKTILKNIATQSSLKEVWKKSLGDCIYHVCNHVPEKIIILTKEVEKEFPTKWTKDGLTYRQLHILRLIDLLSFYNTYSLKLMDYVMYLDTRSRSDEESPLLPGEIKWLEKNSNVYVNVLSVLCEKTTTFEDLIKQTSDFTVADSTDSAIANGLATDPHRLGFIPVVGDAIMFVREAVASWQISRYESNKNRVTAYQLKIERLRLEKQKLESNTEDPNIQARIDALDKQIDYYTNAVKRMEGKIQQYNKEIGLEE